jgi:hypothetical protein
VCWARRSRGVDADRGILRCPVPMFAFRDLDDNRITIVERPRGW